MSDRTLQLTLIGSLIACLAGLVALVELETWLHRIREWRRRRARGGYIL